MPAAGAQGRHDKPLHCAQRLEQVFARCFSADYRTLLVGGASEPVYVPYGALGSGVPAPDALSSAVLLRAVDRGAEPGAVAAPADPASGFHRLYYREDFFASALHETAHWCIAGPGRRLLVDFGYWYEPDGRNTAAQLRFEAVESKPQALEWLFSLACGFPFRLSLDNLDGCAGIASDADAFAAAVSAHALAWQRRGLPTRAAQFFDALGEEFGGHPDITDLDLNLQTLVQPCEG